MLVCLVSWGATFFVYRYAVKRGMLDFPNERSSHAAPTPRGGGLALVIVFLISTVLAHAVASTDGRLTLALLIGGVPVAAIGFIDDHYPIPAVYRLLVHLFAVGCSIYLLGGLPPVNFGFAVVDLGGVGTAFAFFYMIWFLNLYNFMDGIDGIASTETIFIAGSSALLIMLGGAGVVTPMPSLLLVATVTGFLIWNWPPAKIFMGDVGSGFIGFALCVIAMHTIIHHFLPMWVWLILSGVFFADATVTLVRRWARGEPVYKPHRSHAYQRLSRFWNGHRPVTIMVTVVNVLWLFPLAAAASIWPRMGAILTAIAWTPLIWGAWRLGAGLPGDIGLGQGNPAHRA